MRKELLQILPNLRRYAWSLTNSVHDADDLLQNTVERLLARGMPEGANISKWAFTVCRNIWIDECRARKVRSSEEWQADKHDLPAVEGDRNMQHKLDLQKINEAIKQLPQEQHLVLSMVAVQGLAYREVAEELDIPLGTVMSRLARARSSLVKILELEGGYIDSVTH